MTPDFPEYLKPELKTSQLKIPRFFSHEGKNPFEFNIFGNPINWIAEDVSVTDDKGKVIFVQPQVRRPDFWSSLAIKVVASKYFWGDQEKKRKRKFSRTIN